MANVDLSTKILGNACSIWVYENAAQGVGTVYSDLFYGIHLTQYFAFVLLVTAPAGGTLNVAIEFDWASDGNFYEWAEFNQVVGGSGTSRQVAQDDITRTTGAIVNNATLTGGVAPGNTLAASLYPVGPGRVRSVVAAAGNYNVKVGLIAVGA